MAQIEDGTFLPCPHCGGTDIALVEPSELYESDDETLDDVGGWFVICDAKHGHTGCGAASGWHAEKADSITAWNRRLALRAAPAGEDEPVAWMWQHAETGMTGFVEHASKEDLAHWERMNKPRRFVTALFAHPPLSPETPDVLKKSTKVHIAPETKGATDKFLKACHDYIEARQSPDLERRAVAFRAVHMAFWLCFACETERKLAHQPSVRYSETSCSQCGRLFGPGDHGFSHCEDHASSAEPTRKEP